MAPSSLNNALAYLKKSKEAVTEAESINRHSLSLFSLYKESQPPLVILLPLYHFYNGGGGVSVLS